VRKESHVVIMKEKGSMYLQLTKPKVTLLNLLVGITCFLLATFPSVNWVNLVVFCVAGYLACGGCGALNCVYDRNQDRLMQRTSKRAIPSGAVSASKGLIFGVLLTATGIGLSYFFFNALTALMMILGAVFYLYVYTVFLKRKSSWNVVIGGTAGCFAALSGWTAVVNSLSLVPILVSTVDFLWTPGHLWGLAMKKTSEYKKAHIPMLPVTVGLRKTAQITFMFNVATITFSLLPPVLGFTGFLYPVFAVAAGTWFMFESRKLLVLPSEATGFRVFMASMPYLALIMLGLMIDKICLG
jgi:protoheme IX farnesyltransferase